MSLSRSGQFVGVAGALLIFLGGCGGGASTSETANNNTDTAATTANVVDSKITKQAFIDITVAQGCYAIEHEEELNDSENPRAVAMAALKQGMEVAEEKYGLSFESTEEFAKAYSEVVLAYMRDEEASRAIAEQLKEQGCIPSAE